jgi:acetoin utilization deacetylase AcuC-like enzyme
MSAGAGAPEPAGHEVGDGSGDQVLLLTDPAMERHAAPGHPERHERLAAVTAGVGAGAAAGGAELSVRVPAPADDDTITAVHDREYLEALDALDAGGGGWIDADTYLAPGSMHAARLAAGAAIEAALAVTSGEFVIAFSVSRPPGHHASARRAAGFCLLNNIAIAAVALRRAGRAQRIAILDWDVHHGDGTQAIFDEDPDLLYASTHQRPLYPGSGSPEERGRGAAAGTMHNVTLSPGADDGAFVEAWRELLGAVREFRPEAILISAGYDGHRDDPLANLAVTEDGYRAVSEAVAWVSEDLGLQGTALVLEGGYDLRALERSAAATVEGLLRGRSGSASGGPSRA